MDKTLYIKTIEWGRSQIDGFSRTKLLNAVELTADEKVVVNRHLDNSEWNEKKDRQLKDSMFTYLEEDKYITSLESEFNYINYLELSHSRKNAKRAFIISIIALLVSFLGF